MSYSVSITKRTTVGDLELVFATLTSTDLTGATGHVLDARDDFGLSEVIALEADLLYDNDTTDSWHNVYVDVANLTLFPLIMDADQNPNHLVLAGDDVGNAGTIELRAWGYS